MTEDVTKLPKWAQTKIHVLEMRLAEARAENAQISAGATDTFVDTRIDGVPTKYLPNGTEVTFAVGRDRSQIRVRREHDVLLINGDDTLAVMPWAANMIKVGIPE